MRFLVIGGNGFLGSSLVEGLRSRGEEVRVLDVSHARSDFDWSGVDYRIGGLEHEAQLSDALNGVDCVYHLASTTIPSSSNRDPLFDVSSNLIGSLRLIQAMVASSVRRIVFFSSGGTVYGDPDRIPVPENRPLRPISSYGVVKAAIENYLLMYRKLGVLDPLILRPSNPYGPRQSGSSVQGAVSVFLAKARSDATISIWGDGSIVRDYIYIDDLIDLAIIGGCSAECGVFNAGSGIGHSLNEVCAFVGQATGKELRIEYLPGRDFDVSKIVLDVSAARECFGWSPRTTLREGIERTYLALQQ